MRAKIISLAVIAGFLTTSPSGITASDGYVHQKNKKFGLIGSFRQKAAQEKKNQLGFFFHSDETVKQDAMRRLKEIRNMQKRVCSQTSEEIEGFLKTLQSWAAINPSAASATGSARSPRSRSLTTSGSGAGTDGYACRGFVHQKNKNFGVISVFRQEAAQEKKNQLELSYHSDETVKQDATRKLEEISDMQKQVYSKTPEEIEKILETLRSWATPKPPATRVLLIEQEGRWKKA